MNKPIVRKTDHERGMILVVAIIVIVAMLIMATPFLAKLGSQYRITDKSYKSLAAFNLAEEGIDRALWEMNQPYVVTGGIVSLDEDGNGTLVATNEAVGDKTGIFQGVITTNYGVEPNVRTLVSTGSMPHIANLLINRTVNVNMEKYFKSIWDLGLFGDEGVWGKTNVMTDSFNSTKGAYGASLPGGGVNKGSKGHVGTNATGDSAIEIAQGSSSAFYGNLIAGAGTNPDPLVLDDVISIPSESAFKDGTRKILSAPFELPPVDLWSLPPRDMFSTTVDFHDWFSSQPPVDSPLPSNIINTNYIKGTLDQTDFQTGVDKKGKPVYGNSITLDSSSSGVYTSFDIPQGNTVNISGNVAIYVTGLDGATASFSGKNADINIAANSSLTLILGKTTASIVNNVSINSTGTAPNCLILGTEQFTGDFSLRNNAEIRAAIYMPQANYIVSQADVHLYGAVVCDYIDIRNNINVHYDEALGDLDYIKGGIPYWRITTWQEPLGD